MKLPLSQLKLFLDLSLPLEKIEKSLTLLGLEVEEVYTTPFFEKVVAAEIISLSFHPKTSRLLLLQVSDGKQHYSIVCSDLSCKKGDRVALAKEDAILPTSNGSCVVKKQLIQEVLSEGMLVSSKELHLSHSHECVYRLDETLALGTSLFQELSDTVFTLSLTPNLGHCLSVFGVARELAAFLNLPLKKPSFSSETLPRETSLSLKIDPTTCFHFSLRKLENITVKPSPFWLKRTLELFEIPSVNNVVDITNYLLMLYGQPLHAYDASTLSSCLEVKSIDVPSFVALDGKTYSLKKALCVVCEKEPLCLAGVIGGEKTSIQPKTASLFLEAAFFSPSLVRKTAKQLPLKTESSQRAEKGLDPSLISFVLQSATSLLEELAGAIPLSEISFSSPIDPIIIDVSLSYFQEKLGLALSLSEIKEILEKLGFLIKREKEELLWVEVPPFRHDIKIKADLLEEVARIYGLNHFPSYSPSFRIGAHRDHPFYLFEQLLRKTFLRQGLQEIITTDLVSPFIAKISLEETLKEKDLLQVLHAKSEEYSFLRPSLLGSHLTVLQHNFSHKNRSFQGFEIASIYFQKETVLQERPVISSIMTGEEAPFHFSQKESSFAFSKAKGFIESLLETLKIGSYSFKPSSHPSFHPGRQANVYIGDIYAGVIGEVHPSLLSQFDLDQRVYFFELHISSLYSQKKEAISMRALPSFPGSQRDWTFTVRQNFSVEKIFSFCKKLGSSLLEKVELRAIYESEKLGDKKKNLTLRFYYRDLFRTLSLEEIEKEHQFLTEKIANHLKEYLYL